MMNATGGARPGAAPLGLTISLVPGETYTATRLPVRATFQNISNHSVRLLNHFEPIPVFFAFRLVDESGRSVPLPGAGKIDFSRDALEYSVLAPGRRISVVVDLADIIADPDEIEPGLFTLSASYHNQYGDECFQGWIDSEAIEVTLGRAGDRE